MDGGAGAQAQAQAHYTLMMKLPTAASQPAAAAAHTHASVLRVVHCPHHLCVMTWCMASARRSMFLEVQPAMLMRPFLGGRKEVSG